MGGCKLTSIQIVMNKAWTAARTAKPTKEVGQGARDPEKGYDVSYLASQVTQRKGTTARWINSAIIAVPNSGSV